MADPDVKQAQRQLVLHGANMDQCVGIFRDHLDDLILIRDHGLATAIKAMGAVKTEKLVLLAVAAACSQANTSRLGQALDEHQEENPPGAV